MVIPPSAVRIAPVTKLDSSEADRPGMPTRGDGSDTYAGNFQKG